jgi:hypothetical protein
MKPFTVLRTPKAFNLRTDPFERVDVTSNTYYDWFMSKGYRLFAAQAIVAKVMQGRQLHRGTGSRQAGSGAQLLRVKRPTVGAPTTNSSPVGHRRLHRRRPGSHALCKSDGVGFEQNLSIF